MKYRNYNNVNDMVKDTYKKARMNQTLNFNRTIRDEYENRNKILINITEALEKLNNFIDKSDPDIELPNIQHLFQSAEAARMDEQPEWFQLTCFIHDLGKIMYLFGSDDTGTSIEEQWAIVGDTFIVGCKIPNTIIFPEFNNLNSDHKQYDKFGIYQKNCGLDNCIVSWGHDEFLYRTLLNNEHTLPQEALYIIRYHSLYLWHDINEYIHLQDNNDIRMKHWVRLFNKYDLYSKSNTEIDMESLKIYYLNLYYKFFNNNEKIYV